ncbi:MAG: GtrA family protein [Desulfuromonadales bacterium]|nr:GtrA family protein [Desulfuromonadales bacterium]
MKTLLPYKDKFLKFLVVSIIVTTVDYLIFFSLYRLMGILSAHVLSYSIALLLSFTLQKRFVFQTNRSASVAFFRILFFSLVGISLSYVVLFAYNWVFSNIAIAKILMTTTMFFYNFFSKKIAFGDHH